MNRRAIQTIFIVGIFSIVMSVFTGTAATTTLDQVCGGLSSGKIDVSGTYKTITVTAPEGKLISRYCVKAGSINQGLGPEYVVVNPPAKSVTISHSSDKDISHYSIEYINSTTTTSSTTTSSSSTTSTSIATTTTTQPTTTTTQPTTTTTSSTTTTTTQPTTTTSSTTPTTEPTTTTSSTTTTVPTTTTLNSTTTTVPTTTSITSSTTTPTTVVTSNTEPEPSITYQTIERLPVTGYNEYILVAIGLLMLGVGCLAVVLSNKSNKVD